MQDDHQKELAKRKIFIKYSEAKLAIINQKTKNLETLLNGFAPSDRIDLLLFESGHGSNEESYLLVIAVVKSCEMAVDLLIKECEKIYSNNSNVSDDQLDKILQIFTKAFEIAIAQKRITIIKSFLTSKLLTPSNNDSFKPLFHAVRTGEKNIVQTLLECKQCNFNLEEKNPKTHTSLLEEAALFNEPGTGFFELFKFLVDKGAKVDNSLIDLVVSSKRDTLLRYISNLENDKWVNSEKRVITAENFKAASSDKKILKSPEVKYFANKLEKIDKKAEEQKKRNSFFSKASSLTLVQEETTTSKTPLIIPKKSSLAPTSGALAVNAGTFRKPTSVSRASLLGSPQLPKLAPAPPQLHSSLAVASKGNNKQGTKVGRPGRKRKLGSSSNHQNGLG